MIVRTIVSAVFLCLAAPAVALACPVCGTAGPNDNGWAYFAMTIVLSALPLGMMGGVGLWVYRRSHGDGVEPSPSTPPGSTRS